MRFSTAALRPLDVIASILVAFNLAVAQPLLDLFGRNAEFFIARDSPPGEIVVFALLVAFVIPLSLAGLVLVCRRIDPRLGTVLHWVVLSLLFGALAILIFGGLGPGTLVIVVAFVVGILITAGFHSSAAFRGIVRIALVVPLLVLGLFLFMSPASELVLATSIEPSEAKTIGDPAPVVMIVFDEFPVASLMDRSGRIDEQLFPNFARLARSSTWFRNTTTVNAYTNNAVPAMLDGDYPDLDALATAQDHPQNLFTLLGPSYELHVSEPITRLCPEQFCASDDGGSFPARWDSLLRDAGIVAAHVVVPDDLASRLPPIGDAWGGFARGAPAAEDADDGGGGEADQGAFAGRIDARESFADFLDSFETGAASKLYFFHTLVPHQPWRYLPSGQEYPQTEPVPGAEGRRWTSDPWLVTQAYQRHLLQVAAVDGFIGDLITTLRSKNLFRRSLVIVTADHGISFRPGYLRRPIRRPTMGGVAPVPLFMKQPSQRSGRIDDRPAETIDILPSIADVLQIEDLPPMDGRSLFRPDVDERTHKTVVVTSADPLRFPASGDEKMQVVRAKYEVFPATSRGSLDLFGISPLEESLVGRRLTRLDTDEGAELDAAVDGWDAYARLSPDQDPFPALLSGSLESADPDHQTVVVAVNGRVVAMTRTYEDGDERAFYAMVPPGAFDRPTDDVDLFAVAGRGPRPLLIPLDERSR